MARHRYQEPTPKEIRTATPERPNYFTPTAEDGVNRVATLRRYDEPDPPERVVEFDGEPEPDYDAG